MVTFPTLKRGANDHCASGAIEARARLVNDAKPVWSITQNRYGQQLRTDMVSNNQNQFDQQQSESI
jgi:hypothetical protein